MKTDIYTLLGMIKDDNVPQRIIFKGQIFEYDEYAEDYFNEECGYLFDEYVLKSILNVEVEILKTTITIKADQSSTEATNKIEKLTILTFSDLIDMRKEELVVVIKEQRFKINEIINKLNGE